MIYKVVIAQSVNSVNTFKCYADNCQQSCLEIGHLRILKKKKQMFQFLHDRKTCVFLVDAYMPTCLQSAYMHSSEF